MGNVRHLKEEVVATAKPTEVPEELEKKGWQWFLSRLVDIKNGVWEVVYRKPIAREVRRQRQRHSKPLRRFYGVEGRTQDTN